jgi:hypothetical protein
MATHDAAIEVFTIADELGISLNRAAIDGIADIALGLTAGSLLSKHEIIKRLLQFVSALRDEARRQS